jgi:glutamine synthetase type III
LTGGKLKFEYDCSALTRARRVTHTDISSPIFLYNGVIPILSVFVSYHGKYPNNKTQLLCTNNTMSDQGCHLMDNLDYDATASWGLKANDNLDQGIFLVSLEEYCCRPDL